MRTPYTYSVGLRWESEEYNYLGFIGSIHGMASSSLSALRKARRLQPSHGEPMDHRQIGYIVIRSPKGKELYTETFRITPERQNEIEKEKAKTK